MSPLRALRDCERRMRRGVGISEDAIRMVVLAGRLVARDMSLRAEEWRRWREMRPRREDVVRDE